jgi:hypothetical protein
LEKNPVPESLSIYFSSSLELSPTEINQIEKIVRLKYPNGENLLPFKFNQTNEGFEKISSFKDLMFTIIISFHKDEKVMAVRLLPQVLMLHGYNASNFNNAFMLTLRDSVVNFEALNVVSTDIRTNYKSPSLLDFENSEVLITYDFLFPSSMQIGDMHGKTYYLANKPSYLVLDFEKISLQHKNYSIEISNLKHTEANKYEGRWIVKKQ